MSKQYKYFKMNLSDIEIPKEFKRNPPKPQKLIDKTMVFAVDGQGAEVIEVNGNTLVDGYAWYLVLQYFEVKTVIVKQAIAETTDDCKVYVYGKHVKNTNLDSNVECDDKIRVWKIDANTIPDGIKIGERCVVKTRNGKAMIEITDIKLLATPPRPNIKDVVGAYIRSDTLMSMVYLHNSFNSRKIINRTIVLPEDWRDEVAVHNALHTAIWTYQPIELQI